MLTGINCCLVTCLVTITTAIRVDWNTNTGPIIPPTPRTTLRPIPPYREPAAVWEDLSNDIPNPNPYIYVPPPPSRPKQRLNTNVNYNPNNENKHVNYGTLITTPNVNPYYQQQHNNNRHSQQVAALSPQYIPNVGFRYVAVIPNTAKATISKTTTKYPGAMANALSPNDINDGYKLHGKYNAKTKKYKAYEKVKYVPHNYYSQLPKDTDSKLEASTERNIAEAIPVWVDDYGQDLPRKEENPLKFNTLLKWPNDINTTPTDNEATTSKSSTIKTTTTTSNHDTLKQSPSTLSYSSSKPFKFYSKYVYVKDSATKSKLNKKS